MNRLTAKLSEVEELDLENLEREVRTNLKSFIVAGMALLQIRERKLFRGTHESFEDYASERFGISETHAHRLIAAAQVVENVESPAGCLVQNERQARELSQYTPEFQKQVIAEIKDMPISSPAISQAAMDLGKRLFEKLVPQDKAAVARASARKLTQQARSVNRRQLIHYLIAGMEKLKKRSKRLGSQDLDDHFEAALTLLRGL